MIDFKAHLTHFCGPVDDRNDPTPRWVYTVLKVCAVILVALALFISIDQLGIASERSGWYSWGLMVTCFALARPVAVWLFGRKHNWPAHSLPLTAAFAVVQLAAAVAINLEGDRHTLFWVWNGANGGTVGFILLVWFPLLPLALVTPLWFSSKWLRWPPLLFMTALLVSGELAWPGLSVPAAVQHSLVMGAAFTAALHLIAMVGESVVQLADASNAPPPEPAAPDEAAAPK